MIPSDIVLTLFFMMWYFLIGIAILFIISGLDDLFFDVYFFYYFLKRKWKVRKYKPLIYKDLITKEQQFIAVMTPCWHERGVIGDMLLHNSNSIDYNHYKIFVGLYPNDPETVKEVKNAAKINPHIVPVIGGHEGPSNKAMNLNHVYEFIMNYEIRHQMCFDIFVFHDSEDIIHPRSFLLYNYLIPRKDMIQIPVFPLEVPYYYFTHWLYADEFTENHTKDIIVREAIHGHVPSAGVGTAFQERL